MRKIINRKIYDTDTATEICGYWNGYSWSDFRVLQEDLYRTPRGAYFIHGQGGAMTQYAESDGNMRCGGERITPISEEEARDFCEAHGSVEKYEEFFGEPEEPGDNSAAEALKEARKRKGLTQIECAEKLGIPPRTLQNYEMGSRQPAPWVLELILEKIESF